MLDRLLSSSCSPYRRMCLTIMSWWSDSSNLVLLVLLFILESKVLLNNEVIMSYIKQLLQLSRSKHINNEALHDIDHV